MVLIQKLRPDVFMSGNGHINREYVFILSECQQTDVIFSPDVPVSGRLFFALFSVGCGCFVMAVFTALGTFRKAKYLSSSRYTYLAVRAVFYVVLYVLLPNVVLYLMVLSLEEILNYTLYLVEKL